jgi:outer membrane biogenesis lipoprotein LolB
MNMFKPIVDFYTPRVLKQMAVLFIGLLLIGSCMAANGSSKKTDQYERQSQTTTETISDWCAAHAKDRIRSGNDPVFKRFLQECSKYYDAP